MNQNPSDLDRLRAEIAEAKEANAEPEEPGMGQPDPTRIAIEMVAGVGVGAFLGYQIDSHFDTLPIFFIICFFLGVAGGAFNIYKLACRYNSEE